MFSRLVARISIVSAMVLLACVGRLIAAESPYLYGIHDHEPRPEEYLSHIRNYVPNGWVTGTVAIGHDPNDNSGVDFTWFANQNTTVICRINNGYFPNGTIPLPEDYANFATRCANFVRNSPGCNIWIIGNELNIAGEWPARGTHCAYVPPQSYADCYRACYNAIKAVNPANKILSQPSAPFSGPFNAGGLGGGYTRDGCPLSWVDYEKQMLTAIQASGGIDGIALHVYARGYGPGTVTTTAKMGSLYASFFCYKDWIDYGIPSTLYSLPAYITECDGYYYWKGGHPENASAHYEPGWMQEVYREIDSYNRIVALPGHKPVIRCVNMYRWCNYYDGWNIDSANPPFVNPYKAQIMSDLDAALAMRYSWPGSVTVPGSWSDDFNDTWIDDNAPEPDWVRTNQNGGDSQESGGYLKLTGTTGSPSLAVAKNSEYMVYQNFDVSTKILLADVTSTTGTGSAEIRFRTALDGTGYSLSFRPGDSPSAISLRRSDTGEVIQGKTVNYNLPNGATFFVKINCNDSNLDVKVGTTSGGSDVANWVFADSTFAGQGCFWLMNNQLMDVEFDYFTYEPRYPAILGQVKDSFGKPLGGVTVSMNTGGYSATTDTDGYYAIANINPGIYTITAAKTGYGSQLVRDTAVQVGTFTFNFTLTDNTKPTTPVVTDAGAYQTSSSSVTFSWTSSDPETAITDYRTAVSRTTQITDLVPGGAWQSVGLATTHTRSGLSLANGLTYFCLVRAVNAVNLVSTQGVSDGVRIAKGCATVSLAKAETDGKLVALDDRIVSASLADCIYVEDPERTNGIRVLTTGVAEGTQVDLAGTLQTANGERQMTCFALIPGTGGHDLRPHGMANRALYGTGMTIYTPGYIPASKAGIGLPTIGLLVTVWGRVTESGTGYCLIRDGMLRNATVKATFPTGVSVPLKDKFVVLTGINTVDGLTLSPILRVRKLADIVTIE